MTPRLEDLKLEALLEPLWGNKNPPQDYLAEYELRLRQAILGPDWGREFFRATARIGDRLNAERERKQ